MEHAWVLIPYSRMLIGKGQLDSAYNTLQNALVIANEFSLINFKIDILHLLSRCYSKKGEFKEANSYLLKYYALRDSVFTADSHKTINMLKTKNRI
ncbi:MAG: tetratricopeptide repeat protein [Bacteroidia bacterium]